MYDVDVHGNHGWAASVLHSTDADVHLERVTLADNAAELDETTWYRSVLVQVGGELELFNTVITDEPFDLAYYLVYSVEGQVFAVNSLFDVRQTVAAIRTDGLDESSIEVQSSVFLADTGSIGVQTGRDTPLVEYSDFYTFTYPYVVGSQYHETPPGTSNIEVDPRFADADAGDFTLDEFSPLIDAGNPAAAYDDTDGTRNDIGPSGGPKGP
jgi:hypothetical protein